MNVKIKILNRALIAAVLLLTTTSCTVFGDKNKIESRDEATASAEKLFNKGLKHNKKKNYSLAIETFETLESRYPFGVYAQQAQLETAYAHYKQNEPAEAQATLDRFLKINPLHKDVDYVYYLKGLINFNMSKSVFDRFTRRNAASMDPLPLQESFNYFRQVTERFPDSRYSSDAKQRMIHLRNLLASHELEVARFYAKRGAYSAVADRAAYVVEHYQQANVIPEALLILANAYQKLGLTEAENEARQVLKHNYPEKNEPVN